MRRDRLTQNAMQARLRELGEDVSDGEEEGKIEDEDNGNGDG